MTRAEAQQALQSLATLAAYLDRTFPDAPGETVVGQAIWLLEHLHRIETMRPPLLAAYSATQFPHASPKVSPPREPPIQERG